MYKACIVIPVYRHGSTLAGVIRTLPQVPVFVVDDGNGPEDKALIGQAINEFPLSHLVVREKNGGKGASIFDGLTAAKQAGYSHALCIDADGQHDASTVPFFLSESTRHPDSAICGYPCFDESVPELRSKGRQISTRWAHIVTLSRTITDALCGFRIYPVEKTLVLARGLDLRMGFDPEILVRLYWAGVPLLFHPIKVLYPADGVSNYRYFRDNVTISLMWMRLFFGMLPRIPFLLHLRRLAEKQTA